MSRLFFHLPKTLPLFFVGALAATSDRRSTIYTQEQSELLWKPPTRKELIDRLKTTPEFDLLIVGGGATGSGCALDATTRGLNVALVERDDFASGTSSKSTKMLHGGVRYLEKAIMGLDFAQFHLVWEALHERATVMKIAPHVSYELAILLPVYQSWKVPYYWLGSKAYDLMSGRQSLTWAYFLNKTKVMEIFPTLRDNNLKGGIVYHDGGMNDARLNVSIALTANKHGATCVNHMAVQELIHENGPDSQVVGAICRDMLTGEQVTVKAKGVISAAGPFTDGIRTMDDPSTQKIVSPAAGTHIMLPNYLIPPNLGLLDPQTSDGRVVYVLPWENSVLAGTTDSPVPITQNPRSTEEEIQWILKEVQKYMNSDVELRREDVLAAWAGIRPLVSDPNAKDTASVVRNHLITVSKNNLITIAGGKWTTYRVMAQETIDKAIELFRLRPARKCVTTDVPLVGAQGYSDHLFIKLIQKYGYEEPIARHLAKNYGGRSILIAEMEKDNRNCRLAHGLPYVETEVRYACRNEYAEGISDVIGRRTRLSFVNVKAALNAIPRIADIMAEEKGWSFAKKRAEIIRAKQYLLSMGLSEKDVPEALEDAGEDGGWKFIPKWHFAPGISAA